MKKASVFWLLPFILFILLCVFLARGLWLNPHELPSARLNQPVPAFQLSALFTDEQLLLDQQLFQGQITLLNVFASWCAACIEEQPMLERMGAQGYRLVGLNYRDDLQQARSWIKAYGNPYAAIIFDPKAQLSIDLGVYGAPELFIIDTHGMIRYRHVGLIDEQSWQEQIVPLIKQLEGQG